MIVPSNRLLFWVAIALPFLIIAPLFPLFTRLSIFVVILIPAIALLDAWLARKGAKDTHVLAPDLVRLSKDRKGSFALQIRSDRPGKMRLRLGLPFPQEIRAEKEEMDAVVPGEGLFRILWECTPLRRGKYVLENVYVQVRSRLGFWDVRLRQPSRLEMRVYPNLTEERKKLAAVFLNRGDFGVHSMRMVGQGREFEKLREYIPGDSYDQIHWKATARRGRPITKVFQIERTQEVYVVVDASRLTAKEIAGETVLEYFLKAALILGMVAQQQGDLFGVLTFSDKVRNFLRAGNGKAHYQTCREALYALQPQIVTPDFGELCSFIRLRLRRRALLVVLTDLNDPVLAEGFVRSVDLIARQHLILIDMMKPPAARPLFAEPDADSLDSLYRNLGGHILWQKLRDLQNILHRYGITLSQMELAEMSAGIVNQYLTVKQRQLL